MPVCLRIGGWSHSLGNTMKEICECFPRYPEMLAHMQKLCTFWRNDSYRKHISRLVRAPPELGIKQKLKSFTAGFAKWRYETMYDVQRQLKELRVLCESYMRRELLGQVEDEGLLNGVLDACRDSSFWRWLVAAYTFLMKPLEELRRWGMVCPCCEAERVEKGGPVQCPRNAKGRRLREAYAHIKATVAQMLGAANNLTMEDVEGDAELHTHRHRLA